MEDNLPEKERRLLEESFLDRDKIRIFVNDTDKMSRGKYAAAAVHAALQAFGVHPGLPVIVLGAHPRLLEECDIVIHDAGKTEVKPGTATAGTNWPGHWTQDEVDDINRRAAERYEQMKGLTD